MKLFLTLLALTALVTLVSFHEKKESDPLPSPLAAYSAEWENPKYTACNTAANTRYLTKSEKDVIYILNLARINPTLFAETVVKHYPKKSGKSYLVNIDYYTSLLDTMQKLKPINILTPDSLSYVSAVCHAIKSGEDAYVGHERKSEECRKKRNFSGECCQYGYKDPLDIIMGLLIDDGVPSLGHRNMCLDGFYKKIGVSIQPHRGYGHNAVLDFTY